MKVLIAILAILNFSIAYAVEYSSVPDSIRIGKHSKAGVPFDLDYLKAVWKKRILAIKKDGKLPIIALFFGMTALDRRRAICIFPSMTAFSCDFNRSTQHFNLITKRWSVALID